MEVEFEILKDQAANWQMSQPTLSALVSDSPP